MNKWMVPVSDQKLLRRRFRLLRWSLFGLALVGLGLPFTPRSEANEPETQLDFHGDPLPSGALARFGTVRWRLPEHVLAMAYSRDGKTLVTVSDSIRLWDVATGKVRGQMGAFVGWHRCAGISADRSTVVVIDAPRSEEEEDVISIWDIDHMRLKKRIKEKRTDSIGGILASVAVSPDGKKLAARYFLTTAAKLWDIPSGKSFASLGKPVVVEVWDGGITTYRQTLAFSRDGKFLIAACENNQTCRWEIASGKQQFRREDVRATSLAVSPDETKLAWAEEERISLEDFATGKTIARLPFNDERWPSRSHLCFSADSKMLAAGEYPGSVQIWDVASKKEILRTPEQPAGYHCVAAFSPDNESLAAAVWPSIRRWQIPAGKEIGPERGHVHTIAQAALSPNGKTLVSQCYGSIRGWDVATRKQKFHFETGEGTTNPFHNRLLFSPDGNHFVSLAADDKLCLWDAQTGKVRRQFLPPPFTARQVADLVGLLAPPGQGSLVPRAITVALGMEKNEDAGIPLVFSRDGKTLITHFADETEYFWDMRTGRQIGSRRPDLAMAKRVLCRSTDGKVIAYLDKTKNVRFLDAWRNQELANCGPTVGLGGFERAFSTDAKSLALTHFQGSRTGKRFALLSLLEVHTGKVRRQFFFDYQRQKEDRILETADGDLILDRETIRALAFSPNHRLLATAASDGAIRLWDIASGSMIKHFSAHPGGVSSLGFSRDGKILISTGYDTTIVFWDVLDLTRFGRKLQPLHSPEQILKLWTDLASADAQRAFDAQGELAAIPKETVPFLRERLKPVPHLDPARLAQWTKDLESNDFPVRQKAAKELEKLGELAEPVVREALRKPGSLERRQRLDLLVRQLKKNPLTPRQIRELRAVEVVEKIGSAEARIILETLSKGAPEARLTRDARDALERMAKE
jgi:WD40 repeat protein